MRTSYSPLAKTLHWLTVLVLVVQYALGWLMPHLRRNTIPSSLNNLHMSFGFVVLVIIVVRLVVRLKEGAPADEPGLPRWQTTLAHATHWTLYVLLAIFMITGWIFSSVHGYQLTFFGLFPIPPIAPADWVPGRSIGEIHHLLVWPVISVAALHILAALWHHLIARDGVLRRMLPQN
jgi:cytochrome b561